MTVSYNLDVASTSLVGFFRLQLRWRGSIWKCVLAELLLFCVAFFFFSQLYRNEFILTDEQRQFWDELAALFDQKMEYIPLTFMLGFFVTIIVKRWNEIFINIGWIDQAALTLTTYLRGNDDECRMLRRNTIRYMVLTQVLVFRDISLRVRKRFPTLETLIPAGLLQEQELDAFLQLQLHHRDELEKLPLHFLPCHWANSMLHDARLNGKIPADLMLNEIIKNILEFRKGLATLLNFDWVPIPLVYPQVVFLAVRAYFVLSLIARQSVLIDGEKPSQSHPAFPFVPFFMTALQFIFYVGWMKVAENLMNPLGEDDDDFECNYLIDRNLSLGLLIVDELHGVHPRQEKDAFWDKRVVSPLYSEDTAGRPLRPQIGSAAAYEPQKDEIVMMPHCETEPGSVAECDGDKERLLPCNVSIVSVNRGGLRSEVGSRVSLSSRKSNTRRSGIFHAFTKQFSREGRVARPSRLRSSTNSIITPTTGETDPGLGSATSSISILNALAKEANRTAAVQNPGMLLTPTDLEGAPSRPESAGPSPSETLMAVPEEDEETQRTSKFADLLRWKAASEKEERERMEREQRKEDVEYEESGQPPAKSEPRQSDP